ncbi:hypothetical protein NLU13_1646 [Sarocladium strictum]|uniref:Sec39 domain-containing protein n=1 Tax=Sarocladium strictum TaxID=5046 RepID=A0AA39LCE9_SARSR|nr:hypothetical protein NLU13_1646 [Sarocladium strictum]
MQEALSPAKATLLAVHFAAISDIDSFRQHCAEYSSILGQELLLRIILTHLPETLDPSTYTPLLQELQDGGLKTLPGGKNHEIDSSSIDSLSEQQALRKVRKLGLLDLAWPDAPTQGHNDPLTLFLFHRAYIIDRDTGLINIIPDLLLPFAKHCDAITTWLLTTILPLSRRNFEYHPGTGSPLSISVFEQLSDPAAVQYLLSEISQDNNIPGSVGRDLRGLLGPWFNNPARWSGVGDAAKAPGWAYFLQWLTTQASRSWTVAVQAIEEYNGPADIDQGPVTTAPPQNSQFDHLLKSYLRAALASAYSIQESSLDGLLGTWQILRRVQGLLDTGELASLEVEAEALPVMSGLGVILSKKNRNAGDLRSNLLDESNEITSPNPAACTMLRGLTLSVFILKNLGALYSVRTIGEMVLLQDAQEQRSEFLKVVRLLSNNAPRDDDAYWARARTGILWLHSWGASSPNGNQGIGPFGMVARHDIDMEMLKAMLANNRFSLARTIYEDATELPLSADHIEEAVLSSAFHAFDNASNPNRTRGGLKKCDDITMAFPRTLPPTNARIMRMRALITATHGLSSYRLVLKQGEPFTPVVLRVHSDPISIIEKVLEQNLAAYTRVGEFVEISKNLVIAGLLTGSKMSKQEDDASTQEAATSIAEKRIVAMCIEAALHEDDFETAYSYVISRLGGPASTEQDPSIRPVDDHWSWTSALKAGQYVRTQRSLPPTHLGTSSGNPEIRHLEQRLECLATALRIAPASQLLEILKTFRRCEEQLDSAIAEEAAKEDAWDAVGDVRNAPGSFDQPDPDRMYPPRNITASASARQAEEAPMSLFDLSRATARIASKNFTSLSGLHSGGALSPATSAEPSGALDQARVRKRDQLRDAATGTLVSGVGWLIGANVTRPANSDETS